MNEFEQLFAGGKIKLMLGDCFKHYQRIPKQSVNLVLTDPPFGALKEKQSWDVTVDLARLEMTLDWILKPDGQIIVFCDLSLMQRLLNELSGFRLRCYHVWHKYQAMPISRLLPLPDSEFIIVLYRNGSKMADLAWHPRAALPKDKTYRKRNNQLFSPTRRMRKSEFSENEDGSRWIGRVLTAPSKPSMLVAERTSHPTQKPISLCRMLIKTYSNSGDMILDPFAGSGSTLLAAWREGRTSTGFEINSEYCAEACARIELATSQTELPLGTPNNSVNSTQGAIYD